MAKVTGKFQITLPKALVDQYGICVGDELELKSMGEVIRIERRNTVDATRTRHERLNLFDSATKRQATRRVPSGLRVAPSRGWKRKELYVRGRSR
jgi:bifunctional DNA-binding transcriptional regulator/antitoxin component of YhaV-PrlF toxin-antitoxin module